MNALLNDVATPDKPESPIIAGTGSLEDDFTINEAGEQSLMPEVENAKTESPLIEADDSAQNHASSHQKLDINALHSRLPPQYCRWVQLNNEYALHFDYTKFSYELKWFLIIFGLVLLGFLAFIAISIWIEDFGRAVVTFLTMLIAIGILIKEYVTKLVDLKSDFHLAIIVHDDEIILRESSKDAHKILVFPRNPNDVKITVTQITDKLSQLEICDDKTIYSPPNAFDNDTANNLRSYIYHILTANVPQKMRHDSSQVKRSSQVDRKYRNISKV